MVNFVLHLCEHLLEIEDQIKNHARHIAYLQQLACIGALDIVLKEVEQVVKGANVKDNGVESEAVGALRLNTCTDENQSGHWQHDQGRPLKDLLHEHAMVLDQVDLLLVVETA